MKNRRLIKILAIILFFLTGMNSYSDLLLCHHSNGIINIVSGEDHDIIHGDKIHKCEKNAQVSSGAECHSCFDLPLLIRNVSILNSKDILIDEVPILSFADKGLVKKLYLTSPLKARLYRYRSIRDLNITGNIVLLI